MKLAACLVVALACSGTFATEPKPSAKPSSEVRQAEDSDLIVKEWRSPITFELDAGWLRTLPSGKQMQITDVPAFFCDGVTLDKMTVTKRLKSRRGVVELEIYTHFRARRAPSDKVAVLEFTLLNGEQLSPLGRSDELEVPDGGWNQQWLEYEIPQDVFVAYTVEGSNPRLRVTMIAQDK
jgi:hypothetical protein